jgi:hypothetical protein
VVVARAVRACDAARRDAHANRSRARKKICARFSSLHALFFFRSSREPRDAAPRAANEEIHVKKKKAKKRKPAAKRKTKKRR